LSVIATGGLVSAADMIFFTLIALAALTQGISAETDGRWHGNYK